jgi:hypothetical protein
VAITDEGYGMMTGEAVSRGDGDLVMMHDAGTLVALKISADGDHAWSQTASDAIGEDIDLVIVMAAMAGATGYAISAYTLIAGEARYLTWMLDEGGNTTYTTLEPEGGVTAIGVGPEDVFATWTTWSSVAGSLALVDATGPVQAWPTIEPPAFVRQIAAAQSEQPRWYVAGNPAVAGGALAVFALDDSLAMEWAWHPTGHPAGSIHGLVATPDGGVLASGDTGQFGPGLLARIDANGDTVEQEWFDGPAYDLEQDAAGNLYVMHVVGGETPGCPSAYLAEAHLTKIAAGF